MNKIILCILSMSLIFLAIYLLQGYNTVQPNVIDDEEILILPKSFKQQPIDNPLYHQEYVHKYDNTLIL